MRITVDTNVLISATFWYGASFKIITKVEAEEIELILSKDILEEFTSMLDSDEIQNKIKNKNLEMKRTVEKVFSISSIVEPKQKFDIVKEDPEDNKVIECAIEGKVDYIVSQDNHLLKLREFRGVKIVTPEQLLCVTKQNS